MHYMPTYYHDMLNMLKRARGPTQMRTVASAMVTVLGQVTRGGRRVFARAMPA